MFSAHQPLYLRSQKETFSDEFSDADEFWLSPIVQQNTPSRNDGANGDDQDDGQVDSLTRSWLPPAHHQLLSHDLPLYADLKGYDHTLGWFDDETPFRPRQTLSAVKRQGGGSWLLGFARLSDESNSMIDNGQDLPGLVRVPSTDSESDSDDDDSVVQSPPPTNQRPPRKGVSFSPAAKIQPIPHCSALSSRQRRGMYSSSTEVHRNKIRNKIEYRYDGYDWRNATEECDMGVDAVTGELVHPVHCLELRG